MAALLVTSHGVADDATVPLNLQVALTIKVALYDRTFRGPAFGVVRTAIVMRKGVPESASAAGHIVKALADVSTVAGLPHEEFVAEYTDAASLAALCKQRSVSILYVTPGMLDVLPALSSALAGMQVLSVSSTVDGVSAGMVLGFDLIGAKPKLVVNLTASRTQDVQLPADLLSFATVIR